MAIYSNMQRNLSPNSAENVQPRTAKHAQTHAAPPKRSTGLFISDGEQTKVRDTSTPNTKSSYSKRKKLCVVTLSPHKRPCTKQGSGDGARRSLPAEGIPFQNSHNEEEHIRSVIHTPVIMCERARKLLYKEVKATQWPFTFSEKTEKHVLRHEPFPNVCADIILSLKNGPCCESTNGNPVPVIRSKVTKRTTQGKVFLGSLNVDGAEVIMAIKADEVEAAHKWVNSNRKHSHVKGETGTHLVISSSFMDALCYILVSNLVESKMTPHFPVCYGANAAPISMRVFDNEATSTAAKVHQVIWLEYLPESMHTALKNESRLAAWYSAIFQSAAGLSVCFSEYGIISNDFHSENCRVRRVPERTFLYYVTRDKVFLRVPTFGRVYCTIDFGRAFARPWKQNNAVVSAEFESGGACRGLVPDNPSYDMVRLMMSLLEDMNIIEPSHDREALRSLFRKVCVSDDGEDVLCKLDSANRLNFDYYLETLPRKVCHSATANMVLPLFFEMYRCSHAPPEGVIVFPIPVYSDGNIKEENI